MTNKVVNQQDSKETKHMSYLKHTITNNMPRLNLHIYVLFLSHVVEGTCHEEACHGGMVACCKPAACARVGYKPVVCARVAYKPVAYRPKVCKPEACKPVIF
ncbi:hypothetical protein AAHE18_07G035600 [Arachis hypogaea]